MSLGTYIMSELKQHLDVQKQNLTSSEEISHVAFICATEANVFLTPRHYSLAMGTIVGNYEW